MIAVDDEAEFAHKVQALLANPVHREHLGQRAREYAYNKWSAETQAERMLAFYLALSTYEKDALKSNIHAAHRASI
jgi:glycosyltransferase involved in cell wall biosynthesis